MFKKKQKEPICPLLKSECIKHECMFYTHIQGINPQTNTQMDHWDCTFKLLPLIMIDQSRTLGSMAASNESLRNKIVEEFSAFGFLVNRITKKENNFIQIAKYEDEKDK